MTEIFSERIKTLREGMKLSQVQISRMVNTTQASINRYEKKVGPPPHETLLWYADYFDVSMDYLYGRTDNPQGKLYEYKPKTITESAEMKQFVEMCFDPTSPMNEKLKETLFKLLQEGTEK
jgi:transcriptional regulator with XRE-family HTH domain